MSGGRGVVEDHQHSTVGQQRTVQRRAVLQVDRNRRRGDAQVPKEPVEHLLGCGWRTGVVAAQVHVQLTVGELVADAVRPVQRQGSLTDPGGAGDNRNGGGQWFLGVSRHDAGEVRQLGVPVDEPPHVTRKL